MPSKYKYIYDKLHELIQNLDMKRKWFFFYYLKRTLMCQVLAVFYIGSLCFFIRDAYINDFVMLSNVINLYNYHILCYL